MHSGVIGVGISSIQAFSIPLHIHCDLSSQTACLASGQSSCFESWPRRGLEAVSRLQGLDPDEVARVTPPDGSCEARCGLRILRWILTPSCRLTTPEQEPHRRLQTRDRHGGSGSLRRQHPAQRHSWVQEVDRTPCLLFHRIHHRDTRLHTPRRRAHSFHSRRTLRL